MKRALSPCSNSSSTSSSSTARGGSRSPSSDSSTPKSKRPRSDRPETSRLRRSASRHSSTSSSSRPYEAHPSPHNDSPKRRAVHKKLERRGSREKGSSDSSDGGKMLNGASGHPSMSTVFDVEKVPYAPDCLETLKPMTMADAIKTLTEKKYDELTVNRYDQPNTYSKDRMRKVLASVIMKRKISHRNDRLCIVSLGAGSKSIGGAHLTRKGDKIHDCHAEVLARRGLVRFLYSQLEEIKNGNRTQSIFENKDDNLYTLRKGVSFHLFISKPPCGDASVFGLHENHQNRKRRGIARVTPADGEGAIHISWPPEQDKTFEDYTSRGARARLHKMCCSAKIARWNVTGVQGALLSLYIEPVFFSSITVGSQFNDGHLRRAVYTRVSKIQGLPSPYHVNDPSLYHVSCPDDTMEKSHKMSLNWHLQLDLESDMQLEQQSPNSRSRGEELIECQYGKPPGSTHRTSCLSKKELLKCFISLWDSLAPSVIKQRLSGVRVHQQPYSALKALAESYQETKARVADCFATMPYGSRWLKMPSEVDQFSFLDFVEQNDIDS